MPSCSGPRSPTTTSRASSSGRRFARSCVRRGWRSPFLFGDLANHTARIAGGEDAVRDVAGDDAAGPDDGARSDPDAGKDDRAASDPDVAADLDRLAELHL